MRPLNILTAPTSLGNRPYESDGTARWTSLGPQRLRDRGLIERLHARDLGDVAAPPYRDFVREPGRIRNEDLIADHVRRVAEVLATQEDFTLVVAGDCSVLLGCLAGLKRDRELALVYIDAHSDFNTPQTSESGGAAGMDLALATGRGDSPLAGRLVRDEHVVAVGVRDGSFSGSAIRSARSADDVLAISGDRPFFIHFDVDALDPEVMPFVDSPEAGGFDADEMTRLLSVLMNHPRAVGMEMAIYDPRDDHESRGADLLIAILEDAALRRETPSRRPVREARD